MKEKTDLKEGFWEETPVLGFDRTTCHSFLCPMSFFISPQIFVEGCPHLRVRYFDCSDRFFLDLRYLLSKEPSLSNLLSMA